MAGYPPPYPPPPPGDWRSQGRMQREMARAQANLLRAQRAAYRRQLRGRSSVAGPLIVIALGLAFLLDQTGTISGRALWRWYGHWWPIVLVVVGCVLLLEWALDRFFSTGAPARRIHSGGVVLLVILLALAGIAFSPTAGRGYTFFVHNLNLSPENLNELFGDKHESDQSLVQPIAPGASLSINNPRGDVTLSGTSDDGQLHLLMHKEIYSRSDSEASSKAQQLAPRFHQAGDGLSLTLPPLEGTRVDLTVTLPGSVAVTATADHGEVHIDSLAAPVTVFANHGDVEAGTITGPLAVHINHSDSSFTGHGITGPLSVEGRAHDITISHLKGPLSMAGDFFGRTHLERIDGPVDFHTSRTDLQLAGVPGEVTIASDADLSAEDLVGPVRLNTRNRNINLERVSGSLSITNRNGSVDVSMAPPLSEVQIDNRHGSVDLKLPANASFELQANTTDGDLQNDFDLPVQGGDSQRSSSGTVGTGGAAVHLTTAQGDISIGKIDAAAVPPPPPQTPLPPDRSLNGPPNGSRKKTSKPAPRHSGGEITF